jgi:hypothetical protein
LHELRAMRITELAVFYGLMRASGGKEPDDFEEVLGFGSS